MDRERSWRTSRSECEIERNSGCLNRWACRQRSKEGQEAEEDEQVVEEEEEEKKEKDDEEE